MLDLIKLEGTVGRFDIEAFSILAVVEECSELVASIARQQQISISLMSDIEQPWATADRVRVKQIILNLLTNAIKYNVLGGQIEIQISAPAAGKLRISVSDNGQGIAENRHDKIFEPFERLGAEDSGVEGSGLGLAICRQLAERMDGELGFCSVEGKGSTFWLQLPLATPMYSMASLAQVTSQEQRSDDVFVDSECRVLYIEDNLINARFVELGLKSKKNIDVMIARTGQEGMDKAQQHEPNVILLDMRLPDIHGLELLKKLRRMPELKDAKIYGLSAEAMPSNIIAAQNAELDGYMTKPFDLHDLNEMICH